MIAASIARVSGEGLSPSSSSSLDAEALVAPDGLVRPAEGIERQDLQPGAPGR